MPITALSKDTIRILGSSQVLTTPVSLVKELIDNGLDARGSAIDVSISANTLDKIEVRDNGHGIDTGDFHALGKRGNTSKLRVFEDLRQLGGVSLGFRGEALGSAVELGEVIVTTRTEGEAVAALLKLKAPDGVYHQSKTSHPVGTTVCVQNFLSRLPVRKQTALKEAAKTLSGIKDLLKSYALARPHVKFTLKVLKSGKGNWSFSPRPHEGIKEVVSQVIGRELANQCIEITQTSFKSSLDEDDPDSQETVTTPDKVFEVHAFLPNADADLTKISKGSFVSVDSRPVSCKRGTLKKIISIYKEHIRASLANASPDKLKDPFIRLNIICPSGSYDPNVEPAKDDVLFENESTLLSLARTLFETVYGQIDVTARKKGMSKGTNGFDILMARKPTVPSDSQNEALVTPASSLQGRVSSVGQQIQNPSGATTPLIGPQPVNSPPRDEVSEVLPTATVEQGSIEDADNVPGKRRWGFSMAKDYKQRENRTPVSKLPTPLSTATDPDSEVESPLDRVSLNPWTIAKLNAPVQKAAAGRHPENDAAQRNRLETLPTPRQSSEPPSSSNTMSGETPNEIPQRPRTSDQNEMQSSYSAWIERHEKRRQTRSHSLPVEEQDDRRPLTTATQHRSRASARADFVVARDLPMGDPWTPPPTQQGAKRQRQNGFNKPFKVPKRTGGFTAVNEEEPIESNGSSSRRNDYTANVGRALQEDRNTSRSNVLGAFRAPANTPHEDLQYSLDFENRKEELNKKQRLEAREAAPRPSPHQNRYNAAVAVLDAVANNVAPTKTRDTEPFKTSLPDGDPRAYLMRRQKSMSVIENHPEKGMKLKRAKTMMLPLESVPERFQTHDLVGTIKTGNYAICEAVVEVITEDEYLRFGTLGKAFDMGDEEVENVRGWLVKVAAERGWLEDGRDLELDLSGLRKKE